MTDSDGNSSAYMLEKSTSDWIRRDRPARKNMYYHYSAFVNPQLDLLQAWYQMAVASTFRQFSLVRSLLYFYFWFASFALSNWLLVHGHFHRLGLFIPKIITQRKMLAWWLMNWVASSSHLFNPAKVVLVDCITSRGCQSGGKLLLPA